jgi:hypothetical protein
MQVNTWKAVAEVDGHHYLIVLSVTEDTTGGLLWHISSRWNGLDGWLGG